MSYLLFAGISYYPLGGIKDYQGSFDTPEEAFSHLSKIKCDYNQSPDWYDIVDTSGMIVIESGGYSLEENK